MKGPIWAVIAGVLIAPLLAAFLLPARPLSASGGDGRKFYVHEEWNDDYARIIFSEDLETGTRCYSIATMRGAGISCVAKGAK